MATCMGCKTKVSLEHTLKCNSCGSYYDFKCLNMPEEMFINIPVTTKNQWTCPCCSNITRRRGNDNTPVRGNREILNETILDDSMQGLSVAEGASGQMDPQIPKEDCITFGHLSGILDQHLDKIQDTLTMNIQMSIKREINSVFQGWKSELDLMFDHMQKQQDELKEQISAAHAEIVELQNDKSRLEQELNTQAQSYLRNEVEISGIIEQPNENLFHTILILSRKIGIQLEDKDIDSVNRVGAPRRSGSAPAGPKAVITSSEPSETQYSRPVVVRFMRRAVRDEIIKACKSRRNLTTKDIEVDGPGNKIYVNERLTSANRALFRDARTKAKLHGYKHCWTKGGVIYLRMSEGTNAKAIKTPKDLDKLFGDKAAGIQDAGTREYTTKTPFPNVHGK